MFFVDKGGLPSNLMLDEDKDEDGVISWAEFSGPKGDESPTDDDEKEL